MAGAFSSAFSSAFDVATVTTGCEFTSAFSSAFDVCTTAAEPVVIHPRSGVRRLTPAMLKQMQRRDERRVQAELKRRSDDVQAGLLLDALRRERQERNNHAAVLLLLE